MQSNMAALCQIIMGASGATVKKMSALAPSLVASTCQALSGSRSTLAAGLPLLNKSHDAERRRPSRDADQLGVARRLVVLSRHLHVHLHIQLFIAGPGRLVVLGSWCLSHLGSVGRVLFSPHGWVALHDPAPAR